VLDGLAVDAQSKSQGEHTHGNGAHEAARPALPERGNLLAGRKRHLQPRELPLQLNLLRSAFADSNSLQE
jgi:hypothetical protein